MTRVAFLWHMHQPFYQDLVTGEHVLPWVRLHALKDYWGMVALLREFPSIRVTFNLVPSLLVQLQAFVDGRADDRHLQLGMKPADRLTEEERRFCLEEFFHAHRPRMIDPYPRYAELLARRHEAAIGESTTPTAAFTSDELRDLQVWHKLTWIDPWYHEHDERIRALVARGRGFTEADKATLREVEIELLRRVIPEYRAAAERGQVELSTSPFYHPILPLLCDTDVHFRAHPESRLPRACFRRPEDAAEQLARAVALHERVFGRTPRGLWPSEGSVSDAMVPLVVRAGLTWMATDEAILARTLHHTLMRDATGHLEQAEALYRPYRVGHAGESVACGFRDHTLSDLIGFTYASWSPGAGAEDFVRRLVDAGARYRARTGEEATIFVILDGENAWEHYEGQGRPFLRALYSRLAGHPELRAVTMSEACVGAREVLPSIFPGSWIDADFYIWAGHSDDHRAWGQLANARKALDSPRPGLPEEGLARAREEMLIAEGSDWFWWYGDDHSSEHDQEFDDLFRRHVRNVYSALEKPIPGELFVTNITTEPATSEIASATGFISPVVDGEVTSYFEWVGAALVDGMASGVMQKVSPGRQGFALIAFGFNADCLFIRVDGRMPMTDQLAAGTDLAVTFLKPAGRRLVIRLQDGRSRAAYLVEALPGDWEIRECSGIQTAVGKIAEVQIPFRCLGLKSEDIISFIVSLYQGAAEIEPHPARRPFEVVVPGADFRSTMWTA